ncbi:MAG: phosphoglucomutase/phosphomannomutase alpha/beta/alpha domain [Clostridia bacterium]|nr:phosphoglucomutase/phosphomannomutase alpha/beta/alpha domain [Clostridia bacterium]
MFILNEQLILEKWLDSPVVDENTKNELLAIKQDNKAVENRFFSMLEFGTAGLRGIIGAGINRMNIYTVRHATQGLASLILKQGQEACKRGVVIAYDCRYMSKEFATEVCCVMAANGIGCYLFDELRPTPELSFAIRRLNCISGINITASHNPKEYNGYKAYWEDGAQLSLEQADIVFDEMKIIDIFKGVKVLSYEESKPYITFLDREFDKFYIEKVIEQTINPEIIKKQHDLKIIYTPFHGTGYRLVPEVLKLVGFDNVSTVKEQMFIDSNFPTVKSPNPEDKEGFKLAIEMAKSQGCDLIIGTDPDADRIGIVVRDDNNDYIALTGNQTGIILLNYIINARKEKGTLPANACAVKTIVTSEMAARICEKHNVTLMNVLTGFKFIGEKMQEFEEKGNYTYIFGYEESYGYLAGNYARDKDGIIASMLIAEAAAYYKDKSITLWEALDNLYKEYGYHVEKTINIAMKGIDGLSRMKEIMNSLRDKPATEIGGAKVKEFKDFKKGIMGLPSSNVLYFLMADDSVLVIRPSGTEPKIKIYIMVNGKDKKESESKAEIFEKAFKDMIS